MTDREKAIVMAHTGICMLAGDKFQIFHKYVEDIMGRPIQTIEMSMESVVDEIKEKSKDDFIALCREEQEQCADMVSRDAVWDVLQRLYGTEGELVEELMSLPPVLPMPKMGHWIKCIDDDGSSYYLCSMCRCGEDFKFDFCPNCGSKNSE